MSSTPIAYDVVKISELELIGRVLNGNDEIVVNDLLEAPVETKRCRVIDLANSIKQFVLPIASDSVLGGVKVGDGLTINPTTGVLTTDVVNLNDLADVTIDNPSNNQFVTYDGTGWVNTTANQAFVEMFGGDAIEITGKGTTSEVISVKPGDGITITNDAVTVNTGPGLALINGRVQINIGNGLESNNNIIAVSTVDPLYFTNSGDLALNYGAGLLLQNNALILDTSVVVFKDPNGNVEVPGGLTVQGSLTVNGTNNILEIFGDLSIGGSITGGLDIQGNTDITGGLVVTGDVTGQNINSLSDVNLKENIETIDGALDKVNGLRGVSFDWKRDGKASAGVIAQELEEVIPSLVVSGTQKAVNYNGLIGVLIEAVKELSKEVEELKNK